MTSRPIIDPEAYAAELRAKGIDVTLGPALGKVFIPSLVTPPVKVRTVALAEPTFEQSGTGRAVKWTIPLRTASEANGREWRERSRRTKEAWAAVKKHCRPLSAFWPFILGAERMDVVHAKLTRLGGRKLDAHDNLPSALKAVADAVCDRLGVDDGSPLWSCQYDQRPGDKWGVEISLW